MRLSGPAAPEFFHRWIAFGITLWLLDAKISGAILDLRNPKQPSSSEMDDLHSFLTYPFGLEFTDKWEFMDWVVWTSPFVAVPLSS